MASEDFISEVEELETNQGDLMIPKARFDKVNSKYKSIKTELEDVQFLYKAEADKAQQLSGEIEQLKGEMEKRQERIKTLEKAIGALVEAKLNKIPEDYHELIPKHLSVEEKLEWIAKAEEKGLFSTVIGVTKIGEATNHKQRKTTDFSKLNAFQLLTMGYNQKD
jgi:predicted nuclease with TOPRIM domain